MKLIIIIPAHNEETRIAKTLEEYGKYFQELKKGKKLDCEILVILNACKDNTLEVVRKAEKRHKIIKHLDFIEGGKGFAVKEGFKEALKGKAELIGFVDADMATRSEHFYELVKNIGEYDGAIASRYIKGSILTPKQGFSRRIAGFAFHMVVRALFFMPYRDTQCGCKLFKREVITKVLEQMSISGWAFDVDLLYTARKNGFKIKEIPTVWQDQAESKLNLKKASIQMFFAVVQLRLFKSPFKIFHKALGALAYKFYRIVK